MTDNMVEFYFDENSKIIECENLEKKRLYCSIIECKDKHNISYGCDLTKKQCDILGYKFKEDTPAHTKIICGKEVFFEATMKHPINCPMIHMKIVPSGFELKLISYNNDINFPQNGDVIKATYFILQDITNHRG